MVQFKTKSFDDLSNLELYHVLKLRSEVFVVEQNCVYLDIDDYDVGALHVLGFHDDELVAYARLLPKGYYHQEAGIGRVLTRFQTRHLGYGKLLMEFAISETCVRFSTNEIVISAQLYLEKFYSELGFKTEGTSYLEDDIPHIKMRYLN